MSSRRTFIRTCMTNTTNTSMGLTTRRASRTPIGISMTGSNTFTRIRRTCIICTDIRPVPLLFSLAGFHADVVLGLARLSRIIFRTRLLLIAALLAAVRLFRTCRAGDAAKTQQYEKHGRNGSHDDLLLAHHDAGVFGYPKERWSNADVVVILHAKDKNAEASGDDLASRLGSWRRSLSVGQGQEYLLCLKIERHVARSRCSLDHLEYAIVVRRFLLNDGNAAIAIGGVHEMCF